jgi:hypothetical protein
VWARRGVYTWGAVGGGDRAALAVEKGVGSDERAADVCGGGSGGCDEGGGGRCGGSESAAWSGSGVVGGSEGEDGRVGAYRKGRGTRCSGTLAFGSYASTSNIQLAHLAGRHTKKRAPEAFA